MIRVRVCKGCKAPIDCCICEKQTIARLNAIIHNQREEIRHLQFVIRQLKAGRQSERVMPEQSLPGYYSKGATS